MARKREQKEERKEVMIEKRVERLEKELAKMKPDTYNFLVGYIRSQGEMIQRINGVATAMQDFLQENGLMEKYKQWLDAKFPKPTENAGEAKCPQCEGRGYIGDDEECPTCHPNKNPTDQPKQTEMDNGGMFERKE